MLAKVAVMPSLRSTISFAIVFRFALDAVGCGARTDTAEPPPNVQPPAIATPADASLVMQLGAEAVFVGSGIFKSSDPDKRAKAIVRATTHYNEPLVVAECSEELGEAMRGIDVAKLDQKELLQTRGW